LLLAIDTSTSFASVALYDGQVLAESTWRAGREHSSRVMEEVDRALARLGRQPGDLSAVAMARGPGSFTGVRVGVALGKGLGLALGVPVFGIGTLHVLAAGQEGAELPLRPVLELGRTRYATALFRWAPNGLARLEDIRGVDADELIGLAAGPVLVCGELPPALRERLAVRAESGVIVASPAMGLRRAGFLAQLAWRRLQAGDMPTPDETEPIYLGGAV
jgi:tRNA threonylcarbamoyladenosine biosynthesis protein TsaB